MTRVLSVFTLAPMSQGALFWFVDAANVRAKSDVPHSSCLVNNESYPCIRD